MNKLFVSLGVLGGAAVLAVNALRSRKKFSDENRPMMFCSPFLEDYIGTKANDVVSEYMKANPQKVLTEKLFHDILNEYHKLSPNVDLWKHTN